MSTRTYIAGTLFLMINAVVFGSGAVAVLSIPSLNAQAGFWLVVVVVASLCISPFIAWGLAPTLRLKWQRDHHA
jgi:hypothetical protein